jgi:fatty-acyl-CoA synthase
MKRSSFVDRILAHGLDDSDRIFIVDRGREITARDFRDLVFGLARGLRETGLGVGDRVAIVPTISAEALAVRYAAGLLGCASVFCPNTGVPGRLRDFVTRARVDAVVMFPGTSDAAGEVIGAAPSRVLSVGEVSGAIDLLDLHANTCAGFRAPDVDPSATAVLVASGGTTGASKMSRRSFTAWERAVDAGSMRDRRLLVCTSFAYVAQVLTDQVLLGGGTAILREGFDPRAVLATIASGRVTHLCLVEPLLVDLIDQPEFGDQDLSSLVAISHIGADAAPSLRRRLLRRAGPILAHPYGASEAGIISVLAGADYVLDHPRRLTTAGRPLPGVDVRIERPDGSRAAAGEQGMIAVRSEQVADGYDGDVPNSGFRHGRYSTGDLGFVDRDGYLHVRGRAADERTIDGQPVMPIDIQNALCDHPEVRYAVAIPTTHSPGGFSAAVLLAPPAVAETDDLMAFVAARYGRHLVPDAIVAVDRIPITEQGKPDRAALTNILGDRQTAKRS